MARIDGLRSDQAIEMARELFEVDSSEVEHAGPEHAIARVLEAELSSELIGNSITGIARLFYAFRGDIDRGAGALEVTFGHRTIIFTGQSDGMRLKVLQGRWDDPFAEPLSPENRAWVEEHGKCVRVDCSAEAPYADFIGRQVTEVRPLLEDEFGSVAGLRLSVAQRSLWFVVRADEDYVRWTPPDFFTELS